MFNLKSLYGDWTKKLLIAELKNVGVIFELPLLILAAVVILASYKLDEVWPGVLIIGFVAYVAAILYPTLPDFDTNTTDYKKKMLKFSIILGPIVHLCWPVARLLNLYSYDENNPECILGAIESLKEKVEKKKANTIIMIDSLRAQISKWLSDSKGVLLWINPESAIDQKTVEELKVLIEGLEQKDEQLYSLGQRAEKESKPVFEYIIELESRLGRAITVQAIAKGAVLNLEVDRKSEAIRQEVGELINLSAGALQMLEGLKTEADSYSKACLEMGYSPLIKQDIPKQIDTKTR